MSGTSHFTSSEISLLPTKQEARWAPEPVWTFLTRAKSLAPPGMKIADHSVLTCNTQSNT